MFRTAQTIFAFGLITFLMGAYVLDDQDTPEEDYKFEEEMH